MCVFMGTRAGPLLPILGSEHPLLLPHESFMEQVTWMLQAINNH